MSVMDRFSIMTFPWGVPPPKVSELVELAQQAEKLGFHSISLPQHLVLPTEWIYKDFPNREALDLLVVLPAIAVATKTIRLGPNSLILPLLPPYFWAKYLATLDVMTEGRVIAGMALGWAEEDFEVAGADLGQRGRISDEQLEIITRLWREDRVSHHGRFYSLNNAELEPKPVQKPHLPIWLGGGLPSIPRAARYARYLVASWPSVQDIRDKYMPKLQKERERWGTNTELCLLNYVIVMEDEHALKTQVLPQLTKAAGIEFALSWAGHKEISLRERTISPEEVAFIGTPEQCARRIKEYQQAGVSHFILDFQYHGLTSLQFSIEQMDAFVEKVVPLL